ncbi:MAG: glutathione S-transferase family protein [Moraxellaceae bacterium]|jgi:glutathione S-transferase|nr:glutathione S-transferase family protein [Moraxellaceae bacterium]
MQLYHTPHSHFSRKVRILLEGLGIAVELVNAGDTARQEPSRFGHSPLLRVPVLRDGEDWVFDSDVISAHLVRTRDPADRFGVLRHDLPGLNARSVMNGVMAAEVELILAARTGLDTRGQPRFDKARQVIAAGLAWLEGQEALFAGEPDYLSFHLVCLWEHLHRYGHFPPLALPQLARHAARVGELPIVAATRAA